MIQFKKKGSCYTIIFHKPKLNIRTFFIKLFKRFYGPFWYLKDKKLRKALNHTSKEMGTMNNIMSHPINNYLFHGKVEEPYEPNHFNAPTNARIRQRFLDSIKRKT